MRRIAILVTLLTTVFAAAQHAEELRVRTRFGTFTLDGKSRLLFNGHLIEPVMRANSGIDVGTPFHIGDSDVVLVTIIGGTACPYLYHFVTVAKSTVKATPEFGTCNEALPVERHGDSISVTLHDYRGPFEPEAERKAAEKRTEVFIFRAGVVNRNGKPIR